MLLGGQIFKPYKTPDEWTAHVREMDYGAVYFPVDSSASEDEIDAYGRAARENGFVIAEVGVWRNPLG